MTEDRDYGRAAGPASALVDFLTQWRRFRTTGRADDLEKAIAVGRNTLKSIPAGTSERVWALGLVGGALAYRFEATRSPEDAEEGARLYRELLPLLRDDDRQGRLTVLSNLATFLLFLAERTGAWEPLVEGTLAARELCLLATAQESDPDALLSGARLLSVAMALLPAEHPDQAALSGLHGSVLLDWTRKTGDLSQIDVAEEHIRRALRLCPPEDPNHSRFLAILNDLLWLRYEQRGTMDDLEAALTCSRQVLERYPPDHPVVFACMMNLGTGYVHRYMLTDVMADIDEAVDWLRRAVSHAPTPRERARAEEALAEADDLRGPLREWRIPPGGLEYVDVPVESDGSATTANLEADDVITVFRRLETMTLEYESSGDSALLDRAVEMGRRFLATRPAGHPDRGLIGIKLGPALMLRFEAKGDPDDLDEGIDLLREAVRRPSLGAVHPGPDLVSELYNLAAALLKRHEHDHSGADIDEALGYARRVVELTPPDHPDRSRNLGLLGSALFYRSVHLGDRQDLDQAIEIGHQAMDAATSPPMRAEALGSLGHRLRHRFLVTKDLGDLDRAIDYLRATLAVEDHPLYRFNLGLALHDRWREKRVGDDLREAAEQFRSQIAAERIGSPLRTTGLLALAMALTDLGQTGDALDAYTEAAESGGGSPFDRMDAFVQRARLLANVARSGDGDWQSAADAFAAAIQHLQHTVWRGLSRADRERLLTRWSGLARDAAASAIASGAPERAVELLDQGRALLWGQALDTRAELTALQAAQPELAERLAAVRTEYEALSWSDARGESDVAERRRRLSREWEDLVTAVRALPGFENFLMPTPFRQLKAAAADGPVAMVNVSRYRCDALLVAPEGVTVVPLPELTAEQAEQRTRQYLATLARLGTVSEASGPREQALLSILEWLWETVAAPVLRHVAKGERLWWCATGPLALLPLHAAGYHDPDDARAGSSVLDHVVPSATPTLRALIHARRSAAQRVQHRLLAVACHERPHYAVGMPDLPSARHEVELLATRYADVTPLTGRSATRSRVMELLSTHCCVHFACHGEPAPGGQSRLLLTDAPLTMADIARLHLADAHLAVLSACHTALAGPELPDEADHLAAALQIAGFQHVVSTLWAIGDDTASVAADQLYRELITPEGALDPSRTALALHNVVRRLREQDPYRPSRWALFAHFGP